MILLPPPEHRREELRKKEVGANMICPFCESSDRVVCTRMARRLLMGPITYPGFWAVWRCLECEMDLAHRRESKDDLPRKSEELEETSTLVRYDLIVHEKV